MKLFLILAALLLATFADAATYYVATGGSDAATCTQATNINTPRQTIAGGVSCLSAGDTLNLRAGTYSENISRLGPYGTAGSPVTVQGHPGDIRPVLRPPSSTAPDVSAFALNWNFARTPYHWILRGFEIDGSLVNHPNPCLTLYGPNITVDDMILRSCGRDGIQAFSANLTIKKSQILNCGRVQPSSDINAKGVGVYISPDDTTDFPNAIGGTVIVEYTLVDGCRAGGVVMHYTKADNNIIRYNIFKNFGQDSPHPPPSSPPPNFENLGTGITIGGAGIFGGAGPSNNQAYGNIIKSGKSPTSGGRGNECFNFWSTGPGNAAYNNTCYGVQDAVAILCASSNDVALRNNIYASVTNEFLFCGTNSGPVSNNLVNPNESLTFANAASSDFALRLGSPAINGGTAAIRTGIVRPFNNTAPDIGAFETLRMLTCDGQTPLILRCTIENNVGNDISPSTGISGFSLNKAGVNNPIVSVVRALATAVDITYQNTFVTGDNCAVAYSPGNLTDQSLIGNSQNQPLLSLTNFPCSPIAGSQVIRLFMGASGSAFRQGAGASSLKVGQ